MYTAAMAGIGQGQVSLVGLNAISQTYIRLEKPSLKKTKVWILSKLFVDPPSPQKVWIQK